jgi:mono/diheme cytochrome c family protein
MKAKLLLIGLLVWGTATADEGQDLFKAQCAVCHTIGGGRLVGPDLLNLDSKRDRTWSAEFIRSSQSMIKKGDPDAVAIYEEYNRLLMPDAMMNSLQIEAVLDYIERISQGGEQLAESTPPPDLLDGVTSENIVTGASLFSGEKMLQNRGPSCGSCHKVNDNRIFSSGTLAMDLTLSHENIGSAGIAAILRNPPFPVMTEPYRNKPLTEEEVISLTAYLQSVSANRFYAHAANFGLQFFWWGLFAFFIIIASTLILYFDRKKGAVNAKIYSRQSQVIN